MFIENEKSSQAEKSQALKSAELERFIKQNIPLTDFMNFKIEELNTNSIKLTAPIKPNDNHYGTAFGGSLATLGILAGLGLLHFNMIKENIEGTIVIKEGTMKFLRPALTDFEAVNDSFTNEVWEEFKKELFNKGKAEIKMISRLSSNGKIVALHEGIYVGLLKSSI